MHYRASTIIPTAEPDGILGHFYSGGIILMEEEMRLDMQKIA